MNEDSLHLPAASLPTLKLRAKLLGEIRRFFESHGYFEVETPLLCRESVIDAHLDPFVVELSGLPSADQLLAYLQTSPEFCMKRLLAAGAERIYQLCKAFRRDESGQLHNPEFTMLEWYAVGVDQLEQMDFIESLCRQILRDSNLIQELPASFVRVSYEQAFQNSLAISPLECTVEDLIQAAERTIPDDIPTNHKGEKEGKDFWCDLLLTGCIEDWLKEQRAVFVYDYPVSQAALARVSPTDPRVAERFELFLDGIEISNGYRELLNAEELERRNVIQNQLRIDQRLQPLPETRHLLSAMRQGLPDCTGVALGVDRLLMLALNCDSIDQVQAFPFSGV
ncbi:EF-P lysine aminoacylase EpmA [Rubinisphaera sp.]|uniref:EF-P lysine aminoacylase EpmA n=1 Tax=Rubinisphaera sp. TaxID=2024857 RepID=UPI000C106890|nr:EF-P lysine aminoacylase EpmA [Rubinisphaera sp.]MBV09422.1 EF-P lysine aminoacylase GenX [Rubinisphaera sp.]HCS55151.1 EF-P lysine aminoacylase GenX [Planctomycetaceae bacterium]|tara:strand:- start:2471 stop:3484 length:1014 start_codon:yes stop_codon:yes gene_type:complete